MAASQHEYPAYHSHMDKAGEEPGSPCILPKEGIGENPAYTLRAKKEKKRKITQTLLLYIGFFCLGMIFTIVGPTLLELQRLTNTTTDEIAWIFPARSVVGLLGAVLAGVLIDRLNHWLLLSLVMIDIGVCHLLIPHIHHLIVLCVVCGVSRMGASFMDAGGNMVLLKVWGAENRQWMQALHGIFGVGALLSPLVAEPFLRDTPTATEAHHVDNATLVVDALSPLYRSENVTTMVTVSFINYMYNQTGHEEPENESLIHWAYLILALCAFISSGLLMGIATFCSEIKLQCRNKPKHNPQDGTPGHQASEQKEDRAFRIQIIVLVFLFYLCYCVLEMNFGNYLSIFAVKELGWSEKAGAWVTSGYWSTFTIGRILGILLVKLLAPWLLIAGDLVISVTSLGVLLFFFHSHYLVLWICSLSLGLGISTMYATGITWAEQYIPMSGPAGATFMVGSSIGEMTGPVIIGFLFEKYGPTSFLYVMCVAICSLAVIFCIMQYRAERHGKRQRNPPPVDELTNLSSGGIEVGPTA